MRRKVTKEDEISITRRLSIGETATSLAMEFGITRQAISKIRNRNIKLIKSIEPLSRTRFGKDNGATKLTDDALLKLRELLSLGATITSLSHIFGINKSTISRIRTNKLHKTPSIYDIDDVFLYLRDINLKKDRPTKDSSDEKRLLDLVFYYYRKTGYPYRVTSNYILERGLNSLRIEASCIEGNVIKRSPTGLKAINGFHTHMDHVRSCGLLSPVEVFESDELLKQTILHHIRYGTRLTPAGIRTAISSYGKAQAVTNFRPSAAKAIYDLFNPELIVDPCMGWGGRMFAAIAGSRNYIGIDPSSYAIKGNTELLKEVSLIDPVSSNKINILQNCAEDVLGKEYFKPSLIFTSPPYFDIEKYSDEPTQSYIRYPDFNTWLNGFMYKLLDGAYSDLTLNGHIILVINNKLVFSIKERARRLGLSIKPELLFELPVNRERHKLHGGHVRYDPILVFKKEERTTW